MYAGANMGPTRPGPPAAGDGPNPVAETSELAFQSFAVRRSAILFS
jgi:hypothetical protein